MTVRARTTMTDLREQLFRCEFVCESLRVYAHVRAWDASDAIGAFVAELRGDGVEATGEILVSPVHGGAPEVKAHYRPDGAARPEASEAVREW
jgi:hypothetical protein